MFTQEQRRRYSRNIMLEGIGVSGQEKLLASRVLVVGCGALGSIASMYLAGSGVGHLTIVDFDTIDISNLQRQLSFSTSCLGEKKVEATAKRLHEINPEIEITALDLLVKKDNVDELILSHDMIIEGSDNPATKHLLATRCQALAKPLVLGGIAGWQGQVITSMPGSAGYLDIFPEPADAQGFTPCSLGGILGPLPGVVASIQAAEAIKIITGAGEPLVSRMLLIDAFSFNIRTIEI